MKMKVEISEDQNTLTVDDVEYEAKLNDSWPYKPSCKSCAFYDNGFCKIGLETPLGLNASDVRRCEYPYRNDGKSIFWIKKEVEQDDKKATAIFSDNETVLKINGHGEHDGIYEAKQGLNCDNCFFGKGEDKNKCDYSREILGNSRCNSVSRKDTVSIFWVKKEAEQMTEAPAPAPHRHFDLIVQWAKNPTEIVWVWDAEKQWVEVLSLTPKWTSDFYALGDRPIAPPMKKLKVKIELDRNEFEIEVPYDARIQEVDKAILDMTTQFMVVTQEVI